MENRGWGDTVGLFHITGISTDISIPHVKISDPSLIDLWSNGGVANECPRFGVVELHGDATLVEQYMANGWYNIQKVIKF